MRAMNVTRACLPLLPAMMVPALGCPGCLMEVRDDAVPEPLGQYRAAAGDPVGDFPSYQERVMLVAINRVRADPNNVSAGTAAQCSTQKPSVPPVVHDHDLSQAARFHCAHSGMNQGGLSHKSYCTLRSDLEASQCDGQASCSCVAGTECWSCDTLGGCGSSPSERAKLFGFKGSSVSEVGAAGAQAWGAVGMWTTECPSDEPHRNTLTGAGFNVVGTGVYSGAGCWGTYGFAEFGKLDGAEIPRIPSAAHVGSSFYANYYDPAGDPKGVSVVLDGECHDMAVELGVAGNRTYKWTAPSLGTGCQEYYFVAVDAEGATARYPDSVSLTVGTCPAGHVSGQKGSSCAEAIAAKQPAVGGSDSGCGCSVPARQAPAGCLLWGSAALAAALLLRRRRRVLS
jgi:MYXO-CTERM domain-containing protein